MQFGFYITGGGGFVPVESRDEISCERVQKKLEGVEGPRKIVCACGVPHGRTLWLERYRLPNNGGFRIDRRSENDEHLEDCPFNFVGPLSDSWPSPKAVLENSSMDKTRRAFRRFVRRVISWAYTESYLSPTPSFVLAFRHRLGEGFGLSVVAPWNLDLEASSRNLRLSYGFCDSVLAAADSALVEDWSGQKCNRLRALTFADGVLKSALRAVSIFDQVIPGPYFFVSTEHSGVVESLALFPVHRSSANVCFIDSSQEGRRAAELERLGTYACKSLRVDDQNRVITHMAKKLGHSASWYEFRSDFLYLFNAHAVAEELRGFKLGQSQYYDELLAYKRSVLENHPCRDWLIPMETFPQDIVEVVDSSMSLAARFDFPIEVEKSAWVKVLSDIDREVVGTP